MHKSYWKRSRSRLMALEAWLYEGEMYDVSTFSKETF